MARAARAPRLDAMRVADLMTTDVVAVGPQASLKEVAELLTAHRISGLPVVDPDRHVLGVVSEADVIVKERRPPEPRLLHRDPLEDKAKARTAGEAMTAPAVTIGAERRVDAAAALMIDRAVNRLPVVDRSDRLVGIVTRADLLRAFVQTDEEIEREIRDDVLLHELWLTPEEFHVRVDHGDVTVEGRLDSAAERTLLARRVALVPGVVSVDVR